MQAVMGEKTGSNLLLPTSLLQAREDAYQSLESQLRRLHAMSEHNPAYLEILQGLGQELGRVSNGSDATALMLAFRATAAARRRRGRQIRVQPTSLARRRPGLTRGSKRVPAGRPPAQPAAKRPRKRPHSVQRNVSDNVPSARLH